MGFIPSFLDDCHPEGLLDRDQRTVSRGRYDYMSAQRVVPSCRCLAKAKRHKRRSSTSYWSSIKRVIHKVGKALVIGVCLLSSVPCAMAAPLGQPTHFNSSPKWINPCGVPPTEDIDQGLPTDEHNINKELLDRIVVQARNALMHAQMFREDYVQKTFNVGFTELHGLWKTKQYKWLPNKDEIPKGLGETTPQEHLNKLKLESALKDIYQYLQKFAVGLEQVVRDQDSENGDFKSDFQDAEFKLRATLCEVQVTMLESSVMQHPDITRDLMTAEYRQMNPAAFRNLRDWLIFRDYMNGLEYAIDVFEYFKSK